MINIGANIATLKEVNTKVGIKLKQHLFAASSFALRKLDNVADLKLSYVKIHALHKRALPMNVMK